MTHSILKPQSTLIIQSRQQNNTLKGLVELVNRSIRKMEKRHIQLSNIAREHFDVIIRMEAENHLEQQAKMITIGYELFSRMNSTLDNSNNYESIDSELIKQYFDELDILNYMDFEVTKKYFSFINLHYAPQVIQMKPIAA